MDSRCVASGIQWKQALGEKPGALFYDMQLELFNNLDYAQLTEELFGAYFDCRKNKRNTLNALKFEKLIFVYIRKLEDRLRLVVVRVDFDVAVVSADDQVLDAVAGDVVVVDRL